MACFGCPLGCATSTGCPTAVGYGHLGRSTSMTSAQALAFMERMRLAYGLKSGTSATMLRAGVTPHHATLRPFSTGSTLRAGITPKTLLLQGGAALRYFTQGGYYSPLTPSAPGGYDTMGMGLDSGMSASTDPAAEQAVAVQAAADAEQAAGRRRLLTWGLIGLAGLAVVVIARRRRRAA